MNVLEALGESMVQVALRVGAQRARRSGAAPVRSLPAAEDLRAPRRGRDRRRRVDRTPELMTPVRDPHVPHGVPIAGRVSSGFGMRLHPVAKVWKEHKGIDIAAPEGTPVTAMGDGRVTYAGAHSNGYGPSMVMINHGGGYVTRYAHLSQVAVLRGEPVRRGQLVGLSGSAGTGPHLHLEVIERGEARNPKPFMGEK